jgi:hypothetical protein
MPLALYAQWTTIGTDTLTTGLNMTRRVRIQSIAADNSGCLHALWAEWPRPAGATKLRYARRPADSSWTVPELVADSTGSDPALVVEPATGRAHVAYTRRVAPNGELFYATNRTGSWQHTRLTNDTFYDWTPAIGLEDTAVHIARVVRDKDAHYHIGYVTNRSGTWQDQTLEGSQLGDFGLGAAPYLALGPDGRAHVSYRGGNYPNYKVHLAENSAPGDTNWRYEVMATVNLCDYTSALTVLGSDEGFMVVSGNDGWGMPFRTCYLHRPAGSQVWDPYQLMTASASASLTGYAFDQGLVHAAWARVNGNVLTGDVFHCSNYSGIWFNSPIRADERTGDAALVIDGRHQGHCLVVSPTVLDSEQVMCAHSAPLVALEEPAAGARRAVACPASIVSGILNMPGQLASGTKPVILRDAAGRAMMRLAPGPNNVSSLAPGIYFADLPSGIRRVCVAR